MSKKIKSLKWQSVALEGVPPSMFDNLQGFVGLEECTDYGMDKNNKRKKKNAEPIKRKLEKSRTLNQNSEVPQKRNKLTNGFVVELCSNITPSTTNQLDKLSNKKRENNKNKNKNDKKKSNVITDPDIKLIVIDKKVKKPKLGENVSDLKSNLTPEDMLSWAEFKLPEELVKALMELGFKNPTKIQQLSLPAAIHGRRDILGAAETGSGKTLAFGLPILSGIMKLKEKASLKGLDVYDIPYKKSSVRKKEVNEVKDKKEKKNKKQKKRKEVCKVESCEDGYSSGEENDSKKNKNDVNGFVDEYDVPMRKREESADADNDSDDDNNYLHLSDMLDSDDMETGDDEEELDSENNENGSDDELDQNDFDYELQHNDSNDEFEAMEFVHKHEQKEFDHEQEQNEFDDEVDEGNETDGVDEVDESNEGVGCVKVIDNIEIPGQVMVKTGKPLYALILTPTRELAIQISRHLIAAAKYTGIKIATIVGGMAAVKQERVLKSGPEIVVATPGRLWELLSQGQPHLQQLPSVKFLAIDETDRMIERGHFEELQPLLERLNSDETHKNARQNFVFSATLTLVHELPGHMRGKKVTKRGKILNRKIEKMTPQQKVKRLVTMIGMTDPKVVDITTQNLGTAETLTECRITCPLDQKDGYLYYILKRHPGRTIVFCNSISSVRRLAQLLTLLKCKPLPLHASMPQRQRLKNLERFRDDPHGVLVATDVAARGLDIPDVDHVIHYQVPKTAENYVHRSGRTARANKEGLTILMMEPAEAYSYAKLCRTLNKTSELATFPVCASSLSPIKEIIKIARDLDSLLLKKKRATQAQGWRDKVAKDMDMIIDDDDVPTAKFDPTIDKAAKTKKRQLELMMSRPLFPKGFSFKYPTLNQPDALVQTTEDALQVMKKALETGQLKKEKRKSKNEPLLKLQKMFKQERKSK